LCALAYRLIDVVLLLFIGIATSAALQPLHIKLCRWGLSKGLAVLLIYLLFLVGLALIALFVGPVLSEQVRTFAADLPPAYATLRSRIQASSGPLHLIGQRLPTFEHSTEVLWAELSRDFVGFTTTVVQLF